MIFDHISNIEKYRHLPWLYSALEAMAPITADDFQPGVVEVDGRTLFLNCNAYDTKAESEAFFEAHQRYIDVHFMTSGEEIIGHNDMICLEEIMAYDSEQDTSLYKGIVETRFFMKRGWFAVFLPGEPHMVGLQTGIDSVSVQKIVAKVDGHLAS